MPKNLITKQNAKKLQEKSVISRRENSEKRFTVKNVTCDALNEKKDADQNDFENAKYIGVKIGKKMLVCESLINGFLAEQKKNGDWRGFVELLKVAGMHHDQSPEALGGAENPINVAQKTTIAPEQVKEISSELEGGC